MIPDWFFMVPGRFLWSFRIPGWFFMVQGWFFMVPGWFLMAPVWFFMVSGQSMVFHSSSLVFHGSRSFFYGCSRFLIHFFKVSGRCSWFQVDFYSLSRFQVRFYGFSRFQVDFHRFSCFQVGFSWFLTTPGWFSCFSWLQIGLEMDFESPSKSILLSMKRRISMRMVRNAKPGCRRTVSWASATLCGNPPPWPSPTASPASTYLSNLPFFPTIFSSLGFVWPLFFFSTSRFLVNHLAPAPLWSFVTIKPRPLS